MQAISREQQLLGTLFSTEVSSSFNHFPNDYTTHFHIQINEFLKKKPMLQEDIQTTTFL